jgi:hypothetical protein
MMSRDGYGRTRQRCGQMRGRSLSSDERAGWKVNAQCQCVKDMVTCWCVSLNNARTAEGVSSLTNSLGHKLCAYLPSISSW